MTKPTITQSQKRFLESTGSLFLNSGEPGPNFIFLKSSTDIGVIRNGGRNGARFAPQSFLSTFKKFAQNDSIKKYRFSEFEVGNKDEEAHDFHLAQAKEAERIAAILAKNPKSKVCHLGGGHDHVYPLLMAHASQFQKIIVINIDAHADTRTDEHFHSGTPFRQFARNFQGEFHLFQIGLHPFANSFSTLTGLEKGSFNILWKKDFSTDALDRLFKDISQLIGKDTLVVFSLDADALCGQEVPGVSAVNPDGLTKYELLEIWERYQKLPLAHSPIIGIYELNPLYDTLASISMRTLGSFVFESLN